MSVWAELKTERIVPENPKVVLYRLSGALSDTKASYAFLKTVRDDVKAGIATVVINLTTVERITSSGVGILCTCFTSLRSAKGRLVIVGVTDRNREILQAVGLWSVLDHCATEAEIVID
jgi:anti-anti-sigma factor